jgi:hypothetical protein
MVAYPPLLPVGGILPNKDSTIQSSVAFELLATDDSEYDKQAKALITKLQNENPEKVTDSDHLYVC